MTICMKVCISKPCASVDRSLTAVCRPGVLISSLRVTSCGTLGKLLHLSEAFNQGQGNKTTNLALDMARGERTIVIGIVVDGWQ